MINEEFEPADMLTHCKDMAQRTKKMRSGSLFADVEEGATSPQTEQYYILALSALEQAACFFEIAAMHQARRNAGGS